MRPPSSHVTTCRRCPAPICWALTTANGRRQPVDAEPNSAGNLAVSRGPDDVLYVRALTTDRPELKAGEWQAMPHHATCTNPPPKRSGSGGQRRRTSVRPAPWRGTAA
ncbi:hypothetical protein [Streptomyces sp. NBC_01506]|uniref:hypothetical protein n=1 Tax=Streptomyces sp. NBC_01506 TaxID=2903887 RepID=UPI003870A10A